VKIAKRWMGVTYIASQVTNLGNGSQHKKWK